MRIGRVQLLMIGVVVALWTGCSGDPAGDEELAAVMTCHVDQPSPYPDGIPYVGIHANGAQNDFVPCLIADAYDQAWHGLEGRAIAQPNTFSPDGTMTYVTTSQPSPDDCTVFALDAADGSVVWCRRFDEGTLWSAVEVDEDGHLYLTTGSSILSLAADGSTRWTTETPAHGAGSNGAIGLHFTAAGHIATVTVQGTVLLLSRVDGSLLASLDVPTVYGFVSGQAAQLDVGLEDLLPQVVLDDFATLQHGDPSAILDVFAGTGEFSDNTISVAPHGHLYLVGGGPTAETGAVVQVRVEGAPDAPTLAPGWYLEISQSSAASPAVSPDGSMLKIADGNSMASFLAPETSEAMTRYVDIAACDANQDADPDPARCAEAYAIPLATGPIMGTTPMLDDGIHYEYEIQFSELMDDTSPDLRAFSGETLLWETTLPDDLQWTSVITVTHETLVGTATRFTPSGESIVTVEVPATASSELVLVDRDTGDVIFRAPVTDDSTATVTVGPDGSLYVNMLCLLHTLAVDTRPVGGLIRFAPRLD